MSSPRRLESMRPILPGITRLIFICVLLTAGEPGLNNEAAAYLASLSPMAVGADTWAVEVVPAANGDKVFYGHIEFLKNNGIYILETMNTGRLAREGVNEFMFVLGQARIKGTVQMIINPVAMW
jgi:kynurenine formamidase